MAAPHEQGHQVGAREVGHHAGDGDRSGLDLATAESLAEAFLGEIEARFLE
jgi:hypothetical protein